MACVSRSVFLLFVFVVVSLQQSAAQEINSKINYSLPGPKKIAEKT